MLHSPADCKQGVLLHSSHSALLLQILTSVLSAGPAHPDVLAHTVSNFSQEGGGSPASTPPPRPRQSCLYLTFPLTYSLSLSFSLSLFFQHMPVVMLMVVTGLCIYVWLPPPTHPPTPQQAVVCNYRAAQG